MRSRPVWHSVWQLTWAILALAQVAVPVQAGAPESSADVDAARARFFENKVRPLLAEKCYACHGPEKQKGGLRLDSRAALLKGGENGAAVVAGKPDESLLVDAVNYAGPEMPPSGKLDPSEIDTLTRWIAVGAPWPDRAAPMPRGKTISRADRAHWSLQPLRTVQEAERAGAGDLAAGHSWSDWPKTAIDRFILKDLLEKGLTPSAEAARQTLIRRATFDLTGLPPTPAEVDDFVQDPAPDAYERLVDRLLSSPRYGQRWARHWLDLVRYAESDGHRQDAYRPDAWRYRDYVVRSFNRDKPYDRFVTEQLAGDELAPGDLELRLAVGYLRLGTYEFNQRDVRGQRADILNDITDVTGEVFLGLSIGCARCHDHKFDPISQKDYYRLQAFFTPLLPRDDLPLATPAECAEHDRRQADWERATTEIRRQIARIEEPYRHRAAAGAIAKFQDEIKAILAKPVSAQTPLEIQLAALASRQVSLEYDREPALKGQDESRRNELKKQLIRFQERKPAPLARVLTVTDVGPDSPATTIPGKSDARPIEAGFLSVLDPAPASVELPPGAPSSTGRRLALARWLCRADNPLTARVMVNRVWQAHFGVGLVATSSDFGHLGEAPSHPELLDWLAREFVGGGWQLKRLHRLIMTSAVYRQSAEFDQSADEPGRRVDPSNRLLSKRTVLRLDAEELRDLMLTVSGEMEGTLGGPSVTSDRPRRAIDTKVIRNSQDALLDAFDAPSGYLSVGRRNTTTTPTQALLLLNGDWTLARARAFARRLDRTTSRTAAERITLAYRLAYGREPEAEERNQALAFLDAQARRMSAGTSRPDLEALVDFCHVLLNSSELLYVD
jgi:mono/diheme cytochrome c family protein